VEVIKTSGHLGRSFSGESPGGGVNLLDGLKCCMRGGGSGLPYVGTKTLVSRE